MSLIALGWVKLGFCPKDHTEANNYDTRKTMGTGPALGWIRDKRGLKVKEAQLCYHHLYALGWLIWLNLGFLLC